VFSFFTHTASLRSAGIFTTTIAYVLNVSKKDVPSTRAPVRTWTVVGVTAFAVQTVIAPNMSWIATRTIIANAGRKSNRWSEYDREMRENVHTIIAVTITAPTRWAK
jgi:hypothetical protein